MNLNLKKLKREKDSGQKTYVELAVEAELKIKKLQAQLVDERGMKLKVTLQQARVLAGIKPAEMAELLGVRVQTYMKWECDPREMSYGTAIQFSRIVNVGIDDISFDKKSNSNS